MYRKNIYLEGRATFSMIKPDAVRKGYAGKILDRIIQAGFKVIACKITRMTMDDAKSFYGVHSDKPFFEDLAQFMTSGPIFALVLEKENAVEDFRKLIGATNPANAEAGTIRKDFAESIQNNAVHGSDSNENAEIEAHFFFSTHDLIETRPGE